MIKKLGKRMNNCIETVEAYRGCPCASYAECNCSYDVNGLSGSMFQSRLPKVMVDLTSGRQ